MLNRHIVVASLFFVVTWHSAAAWNATSSPLVNSQRVPAQSNELGVQDAGEEGGRSAHEVESITRKRSAPYFFAPWAAVVVDKRWNPETPQNNLVFCNATIIEQRWALTLPYCLEGQDINNIHVRTGSEELRRMQAIDIERVYTHPEYNPDTYQNALTLLKLSEPIPFSSPFGSGSRFAILPYSPYDPSTHGVDARIFGWGTISESEHSISTSLLQIDASIISESLCNSPTYYAGRVLPGMLCAASKVSGVDPCLGFSGSALISETRSAPEVIGLVNWGIGCGRKNKPTVYTNVTQFTDWIKTVQDSQ